MRDSLWQRDSVPEIRTLDQIPKGALMAVGLVELELLNGLNPNSDKALEAIVGVSIYVRAYADYARNTKLIKDRFYPAMILNDIIKMCPLPMPEFFNMEMFDWLCALGVVALTNKKMGFDGKVLDFNYHDRKFLNWLSVTSRQQSYNFDKLISADSSLFNINFSEDDSDTDLSENNSRRSLSSSR
jgi:alpha-D-ribose 1-methylphosphonate 5-phosphate C-P lyase